MTTAIKIENLSKKYIIGHQRQDRYIALRDVLMHKMRGIKQRIAHPLSPNEENIDIEEFWALKDVNLEIKQGDRVGIIGRNGAGKSTLLKVLSRITEPTTGRILMNGRVSSLLEVGTGFHPELTGRENIFLNGAILGMKRQEIKQKFDEIVAFSEVEKFLDTPVKRYSSGMYVRLAFAVAAHLEPEILIIDEVLAVGDSAFQKKCLGKMDEFGGEGRTVLFVSHNMATVTSLCNKAVLFQKGKIIFDGEASKTIAAYQDSDIKQERKFGEKIYSNPSTETDEVKLIAARAINEDGVLQSDFLYSEPVTIEIECELYKKTPSLRIGMELFNSSGIQAFLSFHNDKKELINDTVLPTTIKLRATIPAGLLNDGTYYVEPVIGIHRVKWLIRDVGGPAFKINFDVPNRDFIGSNRKGIIAPILNWSIY